MSAIDAPGLASPQESRRSAEALERCLAALRERWGGPGDAVERILDGILAGRPVLLRGVAGSGRSALASALAETLGWELSAVRLPSGPELLGRAAPRRADGPSDVDSVPAAPAGLLLIEGLAEGSAVELARLTDALDGSGASVAHRASAEGRISGWPSALPRAVLATTESVLSGAEELPAALLERFGSSVDVTARDRSAISRALGSALRHEASGAAAASAGTGAGRTGADTLSAARSEGAATQGAHGSGARRTAQPEVSVRELLEMRSVVQRVHVDPAVMDDAVRLVAETHRLSTLVRGASVRSALDLLALGRAAAVRAGRHFLLPEDLRGALESCWSHRLSLTVAARLDGLTVPMVLEELARDVAPPRGRGARS